MATESQLICCYPNCGKPADYIIFDTQERQPGAGETHACTDHVGFLLGSIPPTEPIGPWSIYPIRD